jgi:putative glutamine amidotransferase
MKLDGSAPLIGIPVCVRDQEGQPFHIVGQKYIKAVAEAVGGLPLLIPALGDQLAFADLVQRLDGLLVTGSPSNVAVHHYGGPPDRAESPQDPARDATTLPLIRAAAATGLPMFCICRGLQELNVALGGTLHTEVHKQPNRIDHRAAGADYDERYGPRHPVQLTAGGLLARILGADQITVNSLHWQGIDRLADSLAIEAQAPDGTIEAVQIKNSRGFALGVQWHPEYRVMENPVSRALFSAFGDAARAQAQARQARRAGQAA